MKTEEIKQMAEDKALEKYPLQFAELDWYKREREVYAQAIIDTYKEPERVNEKLLRQVQRLTTWLRMEGNDDDIKMILEAEEVMNEAEAIQSASQQLGNESSVIQWKKVFYNQKLGLNVFINFNKHSLRVIEISGNCDLYISSNDNLSHEEFQKSISPPKEK